MLKRERERERTQSLSALQPSLSGTVCIQSLAHLCPQYNIRPYRNSCVCPRCGREGSGPDTVLREIFARRKISRKCCIRFRRNYRGFYFRAFISMPRKTWKFAPCEKILRHGGVKRKRWAIGIPHWLNATEEMSKKKKNEPTCMT